MVGDTDRTWEDTVAKTLALEPDSLTVYQMELPHNAVFSERIKAGDDGVHVADWETKRRWVDYAFGVFQGAGYEVSSAYTVVKRPCATNAQPGAVVPHSQSGAAATPGGSFVYRDALWRGADMVGTGVASISHVGGVHFQNVDGWGDYLDAIGRGALPIGRALPVSADQRLIREVILQMKLGRLDAAYFRDKFGVEIGARFAHAWASLSEGGFADIAGDDVRLTRAGLLRVDGLLPRFFESAQQDVRYT
jgi:oxygen-independent coproporphyrinogen-3 oxidase